MDLNDLRAGVTVLSFVGFLGIVWHVWRRIAAQDLAEAASLPLTDESTPPHGASLPKGAQGAQGAQHE
jgi:hypothetical protein